MPAASPVRASACTAPSRPSASRSGRLEADVGKTLLHRNGKRVAPTEEGERLLSYARRILALSAEAREIVARPAGDGVARLGVSDDFAAYRLAQMLSNFARRHPGIRLDVRCDLS